MFVVDIGGCSGLSDSMIFIESPKSYLYISLDHLKYPSNYIQHIFNPHKMAFLLKRHVCCWHFYHWLPNIFIRYEWTFAPVTVVTVRSREARQGCGITPRVGASLFARGSLEVKLWNFGKFDFENDAHILVLPLEVCISDFAAEAQTWLLVGGLVAMNFIIPLILGF